MFKTFRAAAIIAAAAATGLAALPAHAQDVIRVGNLKLAHFAGVSYIKEIEKECGIKAEAGDAIGLWSMCAFGPRENACALVVAGMCVWASRTTFSRRRARWPPIMPCRCAGWRKARR